ncbi:nucleotide sugar dehydrogenase [Actinophytocola sp.]|uniref:nucleotide sugar dehydrogenase n=1 Tax=Actinophytocola sp. TaxID=1872138 RepID=UPI002ED15BB3
MPESVATRPISSVAVVGMGYVGLPTALALHAGGLRVLGIDSAPQRLAAISSRDIDLIEADRRRLESALGTDGFELTSDSSRVAEADAVMVCVPTPVDRHQLPDLTALRDACDTLVRHARPGQTIVLTSTSSVGTTATLLVDPLTANGFTVGEDIFVASSPERIDPGRSTPTQREVPRVVGGVTEACTARAVGLFSVLTATVHTVRSAEAAELTKLYENTFRAVNIALANEFADICAGLRLDPMEITAAAATKPYGFMAFYPGPGVGGHCIPCDPHYLLWQLRATRTPAPLVNQAMNAIAERPRQVVDRLINTLSRDGKGIAGRRVVVVGVSYKPGVQDVRASSALDIIAYLLDEGAVVDYFDPLVPQVTLHDDSNMKSSVQPNGADWDVALIHTVHTGHDYSWLSGCPMVIDTTYRFDTGAGKGQWPCVA